MEETKSFGGGKRRLTAPVRVVHDLLLLSLALLGAIWSLEIHADLGLVIFKEQFLAVIFTVGMVGIFMSVPARMGGIRTLRPL